MAEPQEVFTQEFERLAISLNSVHERLSEAINMIDMASISDSDRLRYQDMVEQMVRAVMNPENKKVAFLTFKVAEETIKRVCLKAQVEKLMPVSRASIKAVKKALAEPSLELSFTGGSVGNVQTQVMKDDSIDAGDMVIKA